MRAYASAKVPEYWLIDLLNRRVIVMRQPQDNCYQSSQEYTSGTIFPLNFPDLNVPVFFLLEN
jgi:Uma2 family endonuclease